jgi:threonine aldolase
MLAKGRLLGIQFATLFTDNLYWQISQHAIDEAMRIKTALQEADIRFLIDSPTNQQFPIFSNAQLETLGQKYRFSFWQKMDDAHTAVRICTSWGTMSENVDKLIEDIRQL